MAQLSSITYQGQQIALRRSYVDFQEYRDDPDNLVESEVKRVEGLLRRAPFGPRFANDAALLAALDKVCFPGYGLFIANQIHTSIDNLELAYVEVPRRGLNRYFAIERTNVGDFVVVDDFIARDLPEITRVKREGGKLSYFAQSAQVLQPQRVP